jgi:hypothetical protein
MPSASSSGPHTPCPFVSSVSPNPTVTGGVQVGSNGSGGGSPGVVLGQGNNPSTANPTWDSNPSDGFDSGWVTVQMTASAGGGANGVTYSVIQPDGTTTDVSYSGASYGTINTVQVQAAASAGNMKVSYRSVVVQYYQGDTLVQTIVLPDACAPVADTTGAGAPSSASEVSDLPPGSPSNTKVVVTAQVRMQSPQTTPPPPTAITGQIFIFANNP